MIDATLNLTRIHCNAESDFGGAEPYLWTVFFFSDFSHVFGSGGGLVVTHTPNQTATTRGFYPNGIHAGDDINIPLSMGEFDVTLDNGDLGISLLGCLFVLIDERNMDADAIKAGHVALGTSATNALNDLVAAKIGDDDKTPTSAEVKAMSSYIASSVEAAIKDKLSWWDYLDQQDRFVGSGFKVFSDALIGEIAGDSGGVDEFVIKIRAERTKNVTPIGGPFGPQNQPPQTTTLIDDYDIFGTLRVRHTDVMPEPTDPEKDQFAKAVQVYKAVRAKMTKIKEGISCAEGDARHALLEDLRYTRKFTLKAARQALGATRAAYEAKRDVPQHHWCVEADALRPPAPPTAPATRD